jgi:hypothetical protein
MKVVAPWINSDGRVHCRVELVQAEAPTKNPEQRRKPRTGRVKSLVTREIESGIYLENDIEDVVAYLDAGGAPLLFTCTASYDDEKVGTRGPVGKGRNLLNLGHAFRFRHTDEAKDFVSLANAAGGKNLIALAEKRRAEQTHKWAIVSSENARFVVEDFHRTFRQDFEIVPSGITVDGESDLTPDQKSGKLGFNAAVIVPDRSKPSGFCSSKFEGEKKMVPGLGVAFALRDGDYLEEKNPDASANMIVTRCIVLADSPPTTSTSR